jgi:hypothetical protein
MAFENKKKLLFESLMKCEKSVLPGTKLEQKEEVKLSDITRISEIRPSKKAKLEVCGRKHKESIFKRPELPIEKCLPTRKRPDYQLRPNKWIKYSLKDTDDSDYTNTRGAFEFLKEIEERKRQIQDGSAEDEASEKSSKIQFNKSVKLKNKREATETDPGQCSQKIVGNKFVMPEYVVGKIEKRSKASRTKDISTTKNTTKNTQNRKQMKLDHLFEDEEDEDEDDVN